MARSFGFLWMLAALLGAWFSPQPPQVSRAAAPEFVISLDEVVASGLERPVGITGAGDGSGRLFVLEQAGRIRVIQGGSLLPDPFLDLSTQVSCCGERGLLGLAFHPRYKSNGYFFVNYTNLEGDSVVARYKVSADPNRALASSARLLFTVDQPYANHNGGDLHFGPDGYLYISMGDGGSGGDPQNYAQTLSSPLGKILRVDVNSAAPYAIPPGNPYASTPGADPRIWITGVRNPWRFSFDRATGDLYIGDVGQNKWEEVNFLPAGSPGGANLGWRCMEGFHVFNVLPPCDSQDFLDSLTPPVHEYSHAEGHSVTGGAVYRGTRFPRLQGVYFFADFVDARLWSMRLLSRDPYTWSPAVLELTAGFNISAFGEGDDGELYVTEFSGKVRRLGEASAALNASTKSVTPARAAPGIQVTYTITLRNSAVTRSPELLVEDTLPAGLAYVPGSFSAPSGTLLSPPPGLRWSGVVPAGGSVALTYRASVSSGTLGSLVNTARVSGANLDPLELKAALLVVRQVIPASVEDFRVPGTQPESLEHPLVTSLDCDTCHTAPIYDRWRGSMMSQSGRDPLFWAALSSANTFVDFSGEYCLRCHTPLGWFEGRSQEPDGSALTPVDTLNGIGCTVCHRAVDSVASADDEASALDSVTRAAVDPPLPAGHLSSGMLILDPQDRRRGPFSIPENPARHSAWQTDLFSQQSPAAARARLCGTCHNVDNPLLSWDPSKGAAGQYWPNAVEQPASSFASGDLFPVERTYDEWRLSQYASTGVYAPRFAGARPDGMVGACQDCHQTRSTGLAADVVDPVHRDCAATGCLPEHNFTGANTWLPGLLQSPDWRLNAAGDGQVLDASLLVTRRFLRQAATLQAALEDTGGGKQARVTVTNQSGHKLPTGYPEGRRMWIHLRAYDSNGQLVYQSGSYDAESGTLVEDPNLKIYEAVPGLTPELAAELDLPAGKSFHFLLGNTLLKDNRIPPRGFTNAAFSQPGLAPVGASYADGQYWDETVYPLPPSAVRVTAVLYYQTASAEYVEFLRTFGGTDGAALHGLWQASKSPPEVMAIAYSPLHTRYLPVQK